MNAGSEILICSKLKNCPTKIIIIIEANMAEYFSVLQKLCVSVSVASILHFWPNLTLVKNKAQRGNQVDPGTIK